MTCQPRGAKNCANSCAAASTRRARSLAPAFLLLAADGAADEQIGAALGPAFATVGRTRKRFAEEGPGCLNERPRRGQARKLTGKQEAHLVAVACSPPPEGRARWTLRLLADEVVELGFAPPIARS